MSFTILSSSVLEHGDRVSFSFRRPGTPDVIWGVENLGWNDDEGAVTADISVFQEYMEEGQTVADQIETTDIRYKELIALAESAISEMIEGAVETAKETIKTTKKGKKNEI